MAVVNGGDNNVGVLLGNGDGTFKSQVTYATGMTPVALAEGDFNGDGIIDLITGDLKSNTATVFLGNGDGTFRFSVAYPVGMGPFTVQVGDFNGDGVLDVVSANQNSSNVSVLIGNGDGTFQNAVNYAVGSGAEAVAVADLNADGAPDLAVGNSNIANVEILLNSGGTFVSTTSSVNPSLFGQGVTFTTTVAASISGSGQPTGSVTFGDGGAILGTAPLISGKASLSTSKLAVATHSISANYSGDGNFNPHAAVPLIQTVNKAGTRTTLMSSPNPSRVGQIVTFSATVRPNTSGKPTGQVTFRDGNTTIGTATLTSNSQAIFRTSSLSVGQHSITAHYLGDTNFLGSLSAVVKQTVNP